MSEAEDYDQLCDEVEPNSGEVMYTKKPKENKTMKVTGTLARIWPTKPVGKYKITDFVVKQADGTELKCQSFGAVPQDYLGGDVSFEGALNDYQKYVVARNTELALVEGDEQPVAEPVAKPASTTARRGRPAKNTTTTVGAKADTATNDTAEVSGRDGYRDEAVASVKTNLELAIGLAKGLGIEEYTVSDLVALGDMIGRTQTAIFMDAKKDTRTASFRK